MKKTSQMMVTRLLALAVLSSQALAQDWVDESNQHTLVVLNAQVQFQPEAGTSLGMI